MGLVLGLDEGPSACFGRDFAAVVVITNAADAAYAVCAGSTFLGVFFSR
jgi:hypothetical protein